jgi:uncharacterized DUF497 family protein
MYNDMRFEWDAAKNRSNQKKHRGLDFEIASRIFADPNPVLRKETAWSTNNSAGTPSARTKIRATGSARLPSGTRRGGKKPNGDNDNSAEKSEDEEIIRIISAREADPRDRRIHPEQAPDPGAVVSPSPPGNATRADASKLFANAKSRSNITEKSFAHRTKTF